jgi:hypothetical protein
MVGDGAPGRVEGRNYFLDRAKIVYEKAGEGDKVDAVSD